MADITDQLETRSHQLISDLEATLGRDFSAWVRAQATHVMTFAGDLAPAKLVEDVQQQIHDKHINTTWPTCPRHGTHPLWRRGDDWVCEKDGITVAAIGRLSDLRQE